MTTLRCSNCTRVLDNIACDDHAVGVDTLACPYCGFAVTLSNVVKEETSPRVPIDLPPPVAELRCWHCHETVTPAKSVYCRHCGKMLSNVLTESLTDEEKGMLKGALVRWGREPSDRGERLEKLAKVVHPDIEVARIGAALRLVGDVITASDMIELRAAAIAFLQRQFAGKSKGESG